MHLLITPLIIYEMAAKLLPETLMFRDHVYYFANGFSRSHDELKDITNYISVS